VSCFTPLLNTSSWRAAQTQGQFYLNFLVIFLRGISPFSLISICTPFLQPHSFWYFLFVASYISSSHCIFPPHSPRLSVVSSKLVLLVMYTLPFFLYVYTIMAFYFLFSAPYFTFTPILSPFHTIDFKWTHVSRFFSLKFIKLSCTVLHWRYHHCSHRIALTIPPLLTSYCTDDTTTVAPYCTDDTTTVAPYCTDDTTTVTSVFSNSLVITKPPIWHDPEPVPSTSHSHNVSLLDPS
jgi:hypothetical protein